MEYKAAHEEFLSGHGGSNLFEIAQMLAILPVSLLFPPIIDKEKQAVGKVKLTFGKFLIDFVCGVLPMLLCIVFHEWAFTLMISLLSIAFFLVLFFAIFKKRNLIHFNAEEQVKALCAHRKPFLSEYRAALLLSTALSILAVDFPIYPRKFAKTETYGVSLMDIGVGSFILVQAVVSKQARGSLSITPRWELLGSNLKSVTPLLIIGVGRLLSVKAAEYQRTKKKKFQRIFTEQEHVTEYGVHWNFFFTWFTALFLFGCQLGSAILSPKYSMAQWRKFTGKLLTVDILLFFLTFLSDTFIAESSRRMANLTYVLSVLSLNILCLVLVLFVALTTLPTDNLIYEAVNHNGLAIFLFANILTGLVNLSMQTIYASAELAFGILLGYIFTVCGVAVLLFKFHITLKYW